MKGFYYIENTTSEFNSGISAYFETLEEAKEGLKYLADWYCQKGTGRIYFQTTGFEIVKEYSTPFFRDEEPREYKRLIQKRGVLIGEGRGLDEKGNLIFKKKKGHKPIKTY